MQSLKQKYSKALVTGGSRGLGAAFVDMLLAEGIEVWATTRQPEKLSQRPRLHVVSLDLLDSKSIAALSNDILQAAPDLDLVINNAGSAVFGPLESLPAGAIANQFQLLLYAPVQLSQHFYQHFQSRGQGTIVNVSSLAADFPVPYMSLYNTCKAGLSQFSRSLQLEAAANGKVHIIDFKPGDYRTDFNDAIIRYTASEGEPSCVERAWEAIGAHFRKAPTPVHAARALARVLHQQRSVSVAAGSSFQSLWGPLLARLGTWSVIKRVLEYYYRLR